MVKINNDFIFVFHVFLPQKFLHIYFKCLLLLLFYYICTRKKKPFLCISEFCLLSDNIHDYHVVSQGKTTIPSVDDAEEFGLTDVRKMQST